MELPRYGVEVAEGELLDAGVVLELARVDGVELADGLAVDPDEPLVDEPLVDEPPATSFSFAFPPPACGLQAASQAGMRRATLQRSGTVSTPPGCRDPVPETRRPLLPPLRFGVIAGNRNGRPGDQYCVGPVGAAPSRSLRTLIVAVAAGFGVLGWLLAQAATLYALGHTHAEPSAHVARQVHGLAAPAALAAGTMVLASLIAIRLLAAPAAAAEVRVPPAVCLALPAAGFLLAELAHTSATGASWAATAAACALGVPLQLACALAGVALTRGCLRLVAGPTPSPVVVLSVLPRLASAPAGACGARRRPWPAGAVTRRGPPLASRI